MDLEDYVAKILPGTSNESETTSLDQPLNNLIVKPRRSKVAEILAAAVEEKPERERLACYICVPAILFDNWDALFEHRQKRHPRNRSEFLPPRKSRVIDQADPGDDDEWNLLLDDTTIVSKAKFRAQTAEKKNPEAAHSPGRIVFNSPNAESREAARISSSRDPNETSLPHSNKPGRRSQEVKTNLIPKDPELLAKIDFNNLDVTKYQSSDWLPKYSAQPFPRAEVKKTVDKDLVNSIVKARKAIAEADTTNHKRIKLEDETGAAKFEPSKLRKTDDKHPVHGFPIGNTDVAKTKSESEASNLLLEAAIFPKKTLGLTKKAPVIPKTRKSTRNRKPSQKCLISSQEGDEEDEEMDLGQALLTQVLGDDWRMKSISGKTSSPEVEGSIFSSGSEAGKKTPLAKTRSSMRNALRVREKRPAGGESMDQVPSSSPEHSVAPLKPAPRFRTRVVRPAANQKPSEVKKEDDDDDGALSEKTVFDPQPPIRPMDALVREAIKAKSAKTIEQRQKVGQFESSKLPGKFFAWTGKNSSTKRSLPDTAGIPAESLLDDMMGSSANDNNRKQPQGKVAKVLSAHPDPTQCSKKLSNRVSFSQLLPPSLPLLDPLPPPPLVRGKAKVSPEKPSKRTLNVKLEPEEFEDASTSLPTTSSLTNVFAAGTPPWVVSADEDAPVERSEGTEIPVFGADREIKSEIVDPELEKVDFSIPVKTEPQDVATFSPATQTGGCISNCFSGKEESIISPPTKRYECVLCRQGHGFVTDQFDSLLEHVNRRHLISLLETGSISGKGKEIRAKDEEQLWKKYQEIRGLVQRTIEKLRRNRYVEKNIDVHAKYR